MIANSEPHGGFHLSEDFIAGRRRAMWLAGAAMSAMVALVVLSAEGFDIARLYGAALFFWLTVSVFIGLGMYTVGAFTERRWRRLVVRLDADGLEQAVASRDGQFDRDEAAPGMTQIARGRLLRQRVAWKDVIALRIRTGPDGAPRQLTLRPRKGLPLLIFGIEPMGPLVAAIEAHLPETARVETRR